MQFVEVIINSGDGGSRLQVLFRRRSTNSEAINSIYIEFILAVHSTECTTLRSSAPDVSQAVVKLPFHKYKSPFRGFIFVEMAGVEPACKVESLKHLQA